MSPAGPHTGGAEGGPVGGGEGGTHYPADLVLILRGDGAIRFTNGPLAGVDEETVLGTSLYDYVRPEQHAVVRDCLDRVFQRGEANGCDLEGLLPHNTDSWYQCRFAPNRRGDEVVSATVIARDFTHHKRLEAELRDQRDTLEVRLVELQEKLELSSGTLAWFRTIMDEAGEAIFITDAETGRVADLNETAAHWLSMSREQAIGRPVAEFGLEFALVAPKDSETEFTETRNKRRPLLLNTTQHRRRDRSTFPVEVSLTRHVLRNRQYVLAVVRDVKAREDIESALKQSENIYRSLFENASDAVFLTTRDGAVVDANQAAVRLFRYEHESFVALNARDLYADKRDVKRFRDEITKSGEIAELNVTFRTHDGGTFAGRLSATPQRLADGGIQGYQCIVRAVEQPLPEATAGEHRPADTVLLVDAEDESRGAAAAALQEAGIAVLQAETLPQGLDAARERGGDLRAVLLASAAANGAPATGVAEIRRLNPHVPVIVLLDRGADAAETERLRPSVSAIVEKPFHPLALLQRVREVLGIAT